MPKELGSIGWNTRYFHTQALIRRKRNLILKLKDGQGNWMEDENLVYLILDTFKKRFTASDVPSQSSLNSYTQVIQPCISIANNDSLLALVSDLELVHLF